MTTLSLRPALAAVAILSTFLLASCAAESAAPPASTPDDVKLTEQESQGETSSETTSQGDVTVVMAGQSFTFTTTLCMITDDDVLVGGPGVDDESNDPAYLDIDFATLGSTKTGEVRINLGTDAPMTSTDEFYVAFVDSDHEYELVYDDDGNGFELRADFIAATGSPIGSGTVEVSCAA